MRKNCSEPEAHAMVAFLYKPEVKGKEESQRAADVNPLVIAPRFRCLLLFYCLQARPLCWVGLFLFPSHPSKTSNPWNAVHGL